MIRMSTTQMFNTSVFNMQQGQDRVNHTNNQLGTGKKVISPADDPVAAAQTLNTKNRLSVVQQFNRNVDFADKNLSLTESVLDQTETALIRLKEMAIQLGSDQWSDQQIKATGTEAKEILSHLQGLVNTKNESNEYIFAGSQADAPAYDGNTFKGDRVEREAQVADSTFIKMLTSGARAFEGLQGLSTSVPVKSDSSFKDEIASSNLAFNDFANLTAEEEELLLELGLDTTVNSQKLENQFNARMTGLSDFSLPSGSSQLLSFNNQYRGIVENSESPEELVSWLVSKESGAFMFPSSTTEQERKEWVIGNWDSIASALGEPWSDIAGDSLAVDAGGEAAFVGAGDWSDTIDPDSIVPPSGYPDSMLGTIQAFVDATGNGSPPGPVNREGIRAAIGNFDVAFEKVSQTRSQIGARQNTLDAVKSGNKDFELFAEKSISDLEDLDYAEAISRFQQQSMSLQASQQAFGRTSNLSLFNYI